MSGLLDLVAIVYDKRDRQWTVRVEAWGDDKLTLFSATTELRNGDTLEITNRKWLEKHLEMGLEDLDFWEVP